MAKITQSLTFILGLFLTQTAFSQNTAFRRSVPVIHGIDTLANAWAGGLNNPMTYSLELNFDGKPDLIIFDRSDNFIAPFLNIGTPNSPKYQFAPQFKNAFPDTFIQRIQFEDLNCDGKKDLIANINSNIIILKNTSANGQLSFALWQDTVLTNYGGVSGVSPLYISVEDVPAWYDIDSDGDIDLLTYDILGSQIEYHKNIAQDQFGRCDTIILSLRSSCFGHFYEYYNYGNGTYQAILNNPPCNPGEKKPSEKVQHSGGAILALSLNADSLADIIVSDNGPANAIALFNGGSQTIAHFIHQDSMFPDYNFPIYVVSFPAYFYQDVTGDYIPDLLASPYQTVGSQDVQSLWMYKNFGSIQQPDFRLQWQDWLQNTMIDVGTNAIPAFFDWNQDGKKDLIIGNRGKFQNGQDVASGLSLYINIGTNESPIYQLKTTDYLGLMNDPLTTVFQQIHPAFGDLDGDQDEDLLIGFNNGKIWYYQNNTTPGDTAKFSLTAQNYQNINVIKNAAPALYDIDSDGDLDLLVGASNGKIFCYENIGTPQTPNFQLLTDSYGKIQMKEYYFSFVGNAKPYVVNLDSDNSPELLVGSLDGKVYLYDNIYLTSTDSFPSLGTLDGIDFGTESSPAATQMGVDSIGYIVGTRRGGVHFLKTNKSITTQKPIELTDNQIKIFPNPATNQVWITTGSNRPVSVEIFNSQGMKVKEPFAVSNGEAISTENFPTGLYVFRFSNKTNTETYRILIIK